MNVEIETTISLDNIKSDSKMKFKIFAISVLGLSIDDDDEIDCKVFGEAIKEEKETREDPGHLAHVDNLRMVIEKNGSEFDITKYVLKQEIGSYEYELLESLEE